MVIALVCYAESSNPVAALVAEEEALPSGDDATDEPEVVPRPTRSAPDGGPSDATNVLMFQAVKQGLEFFDIGAAAAIANLMIVCIAIFSVGFIVLIRRADKRANEL